jgi:hypothetical protein
MTGLSGNLPLVDTCAEGEVAPKIVIPASNPLRRCLFAREKPQAGTWPYVARISKTGSENSQASQSA